MPLANLFANRSLSRTCCDSRQRRAPYEGPMLGITVLLARVCLITVHAAHSLIIKSFHLMRQDWKQWLSAGTRGLLCQLIGKSLQHSAHFHIRGWLETSVTGSGRRSKDFSYLEFLGVSCVFPSQKSNRKILRVKICFSGLISKAIAFTLHNFKTIAWNKQPRTISHEHGPNTVSREHGPVFFYIFTLFLFHNFVAWYVYCKRSHAALYMLLMRYSNDHAQC